MTMRHEISIEPWPHYDEQRRPWWNVRVTGECGSFSLGWTTADGGHWSNSNEVRRLKSCSARLHFRVEEHVRHTFSSVTFEERKP